MSPQFDSTSAFEQRVRALLEESVQRVGGHARSRLNQARHTAMAGAGHRGRWRMPLRRARSVWMSASGGVAAAVLAAFLLWPHAPRTGFPEVDANHATVEDLDLLADRDGIDLVEGGDGQFYEWAMAQAQAEDSGSPAAQPPAGGSQGRSQTGRGGDQGGGENSG